MLAGFAVPAMAQNSSKVDVSGGYNLLHVPDQTLPGGWYADVAGNVTPVVGVVGQVTGNYKNIDVAGLSVKERIHTFMGGVRVNAPSASGVVPFGQALFGDAHFSGDQASSDDAALQLGGGVKFMPAGSTVGAQVGIDYVRIFGDADSNAFRFAAGVVIGF
jgi:hypothetical protein